MSRIETQGANVAADAAAYLRALLEELETFDAGVERAFAIAEGYLHPSGRIAWQDDRNDRWADVTKAYRQTGKAATKLLRDALAEAERVLAADRSAA